MNAVTMNAGLQEVFGSPRELTVVLDQSGVVIGFYLPAKDDPEAARRLVRIAAGIDPEELARRKNKGGRGLTTAEMLRVFETLSRG